ncbi:hypothetical protein GS399_18050 [Pedobacter sp. HMF7647]|uniref:Uncharacterized protein n=1 Tax=Hufsiella arboris TaxID=2695275 RepID=A0A7K1YEQ0_9SPHI|nr:hypothetical protein [Hufsiella arboris]MXV52880.1 hypothetical protein [Hufsiella arboris]
MRKYIFFVILILPVLAFRCYSQTIDDKPALKSQTTGAEKIYIHYNQNFYQAADTIWFKAYLFDNSGRSRQSKSFYLELLNESGQAIARVTAPIFESTASGSVVIPDSLPGKIYCRAYTASILRNSPDFVYLKPINVISRKPTADKEAPGRSLIRFFPEGGDMVAGLPSIVAFKIANPNGLPVDGHGTIISGTDSVAAKFSTTHDGMGIFALTPKDGETYKASWYDKAGFRYETALPLVKPAGIVLHVNDIDKGKKFFLFRSEKQEGSDNHFMLVATLNGSVVYKADADLTNDLAINGVVPTQNLPTGILTITVLDRSSKPVAERITFVNNDNYKSDVTINSQPINTRKRALNALSITTTDSVRTNLSVSIVDAGQDKYHPLQDNIVSGLLLTGDLRGKIVNPYYYFVNRSDSVTKNLDLLMLTHGWRKYDRFANPDKSNSLIEDDFLDVTGNITSAKKPLADQTLSMIISTPDSNSTFVPVQLKNGKFQKSGLIFYGDASFFFKPDRKFTPPDKIQATLTNGLITGYNQPDFNNAVANSIYAPSRFPKIDSIRLTEDKTRRKTGSMLKEVKVTAKAPTLIEKLDKEYAAGLPDAGVSTSFIISQDPQRINYLSALEYVRGKMPGIKIINGSISWRQYGVRIFLDNFQSSFSDVSSIPISDFEYVKIYPPPFGSFFSPGGSVEGGAIAFYTKRGKGYDFDSGNKKPDAILQGYTPAKEFFSPDYATAVDLKTVDNRTTLYWNPNIILDKNSRTFDVHFYNNDSAREFRLVLEGINNDGKLVHIEKLY